MEEFELSEREANKLAGAVARVAEYYPTLTDNVSGEMMAWVGLVQICVLVYGPRIASVMAKRAQTIDGEAQVQPDVSGYMGMAA